MFTNSSIDESILVSMKCVKSGTHTVQGLHGMSGILSIGNEIEWWLSSSKDAIIYQSCNNSQIDSLHLLDLLSSLLRKAQYAILKMMQALEARQCLEVSINAFLISYALDPWHEVIINYALMKLVKGIRGDASEYVRVGKISQEWVITGTESIILKEVRKFSITVSLKCTESNLGISIAKRQRRILMLIWWYCTAGASILHTAGHKALFGVVSNVCSKDGKNTVDIAIRASNFKTWLPSRDKRFNEKPHAVMEGIVLSKLMCITRFGESSKIGYLEISN